MDVREIRIADIRPYERNPRQHSPEQISMIAASMKEYGWTVPVMIDENNVLIAGHGRIEAAKQLGWETAEAVIRSDLTDAQVRAYRIADNRIAEVSTWDRRALQEELAILQKADFDVNLTGFDEEFLSAISVPDEQVLAGDLEEPQIGMLAEPENLPMAIIRFRTQEAQKTFENWIRRHDHIVTPKGNMKSYQMPAPPPSVTMEPE